MKTIILTLSTVAFLFLGSCRENTKQEKVETTMETAEKTNHDIVNATSTDKDGNRLEMSFNNTKKTATLTFQGETIELAQAISGSGIRYNNENYELRGKGNDIQLTKDGITIFKHQDDIVNVEAKNKKGDVLNMTFNNTEETVIAYLNNDDPIVLEQKKAASGIWYENDDYELRGKGDTYELIKDGETVFKN